MIGVCVCVCVCGGVCVWFMECAQSPCVWSVGHLMKADYPVCVTVGC